MTATQQTYKKRPVSECICCSKVCLLAACEERVAPTRCSTSADCASIECCVADVMLDGRKRIAIGGSCRPLGHLTSGGCTTTIANPPYCLTSYEYYYTLHCLSVVHRVLGQQQTPQHTPHVLRELPMRRGSHVQRQWVDQRSAWGGGWECSSLHLIFSSSLYLQLFT